MHKYRLISKIGEGTFSEVLKAQSIKTGKYCAIKCMKNHFDSIEQVNNLREIQALRRLSPHPNIIKLLEVLYDEPTGRLALVFELMDMNMYESIRGRRHYLPESRVKAYMYQLIRAIDHMHRNGVFHRDIKPENVLIVDDTLKLADFGSCRGIYSKQPYTEYISTRWYRAPECLLTDGYYNYKMDMWGVGCVFFEILSLFPLFPGTNELDQINRIHNILGTPPPDVLAKFQRNASHMDFNFPPKEGTGPAKLIPHVSQECIELIMKLLEYNPDDRLSARQALRHPYFRDIRDAEKKAALAQQALQQQIAGVPSIAPNNATQAGNVSPSPQFVMNSSGSTSSLPPAGGAPSGTKDSLAPGAGGKGGDHSEDHHHSHSHDPDDSDSASTSNDPMPSGKKHGGGGAAAASLLTVPGLAGVNSAVSTSVSVASSTGLGSSLTSSTTKKEKKKSHSNSNYSMQLPDINARGDMYESKYGSSSDSDDSSSLPPISKGMLPDLKIDMRHKSKKKNNNNSATVAQNSALRAADAYGKPVATKQPQSLTTQSLSFPSKPAHLTGPIPKSLNSIEMIPNPAPVADFSKKSMQHMQHLQHIQHAQHDLKKSYVSPYSQKHINRQRFD